MNSMKKISGLITALCLVMVSSVYPARAKSDDFDAFLYEEFISYCQSDYLTMYYTVTDYEAYDMVKPDPVLGDASLESYDEAIAASRESLSALRAFDYNSLSASQQHDYDAYEAYLESAIALNSYPEFDMCFNSGGLMSDILTNFIEIRFTDKQDVDDYLALLSSVPDYLDQVLELTAWQVSQGYFVTDSALDDTLEAIEKFCAKADDNELIVVFDNNLDDLGGLTSQEKAAYKARNADIVLNEFIPAYQKVAETIESYRGKRKGNGSIYSLAGGEEYYKELFKYKTGIDRDLDDVFDELTEVLYEYISDYIDLIFYTGDYSYEDETVSVSTPEDILSYLEKHMDDFPEGPKVSYTATYLDPSVADEAIVAYYLEPPIDDLSDNVIKINADNIYDVNDLFITLAHEGFPGHLYQITYYLSTDPSPLRSLIGNGGYTEGWGMYAELTALAESGLSDNAVRNLIDVEVINYIMDAAVDIAVNGLGYSQRQIERYLESFGLDGSIAADLIEYVEAAPGLILPYGVGLAEFITLREKAEEALGSLFEAKTYHEVILAYGDVPFASLEADVEAWIDQLSGEAPVITPSSTKTPQPDEESSPSLTASNNPSGFWIGLLTGGGLAMLVIIISCLKGSGKKHS